MKQENLQKIQQLRHELHQHPELSGQETKTGERIRNFLRTYTSLEIVQRDGWFYAVRHGAGPAAGSMAFRAEMDALPMDEGADIPYGSLHAGISHKCGHDGHCAALCGLALELEEISTDRTIYLLFQKAEEIGEGGSRCAELIREKGIAEVYAFHNLNGYPENAVVYRRGLTQPASVGLEIRFRGVASHASTPEDGRNPAEVMARVVLFCGKLQQGLCAGKAPDPENTAGRCTGHAPGAGMRLCTITGIQAGTGDFGISAGDGVLRMTLRAEYEEEMKAMMQEILAFAEEQAKAAGLTIRHRLSDYFPETANSDAGIDRVLQAAGKLQLQTMEMEHLWRASEDFGYCLKECAGAMFYIGSGESWPALHTSGYDFNDRILGTAADMFLALIPQA